MARRYWYGYNGADGGENTLSNYSFLRIGPGACASGNHLCAIYVAGPGVNASFPYVGFNTANIQSYITAAKSSGVPQPLNTPPYYVYVKA